MPRYRATLEKDVEKEYKKFIKHLGGYSRKFSSPAQRSVPDQVSKVPGLPAFLCELKRPDEGATEAQLREHTAARAAGWDVLVEDSLALTTVRNYLLIQAKLCGLTTLLTRINTYKHNSS